MPEMAEVKDKTALVTGGANGIGYSSARELLRNGAKSATEILKTATKSGEFYLFFFNAKVKEMAQAFTVAILDLIGSNGDSAATELENEFGKHRATFFACDVSNAEEFTACFAKVLNVVGTLDIVINNAGIMDDAEWDAMVDINYKGVVRGTILALDHMGKHKGGRGGTVVNMSSIAGLEANPLAPIYGGTKHAIVGFSLALQIYYEKTGVRVLTICPGLTMTSMASKFMASKVHAMDVLDDEIATREMAALQNQSAEHVAKAIIELIEKGKNGSVFVSENNQPPYAVELAHYTAHKVPV